MVKNLKLDLFSKELFLFGLTQVLGILIARRYLFGGETAALSSPEVSLHFSLTDFIFTTALIALFVWMMLRKNRATRVLFRVFFFLVILGGLQIVLNAFLSPVISLLLTVLLIAVMLSAHQVMIQNLLVLVAIAGVGLVIGLSITPLIAVSALLILSFYDILAVYVTKHMVKMAEGMVNAGAIFGFIIPLQFSGLKEKIEKVKPGDKFMILGSGDIALPLILAVSVLRASMAAAWMVAIFSVLGLFITHLLFVNQKQRRPMAALPPIAMMAIVGYLIALIMPL